MPADDADRIDLARLADDGCPNVDGDDSRCPIRGEAVDLNCVI